MLRRMASNLTMSVLLFAVGAFGAVGPLEAGTIERAPTARSDKSERAPTARSFITDVTKPLSPGCEALLKGEARATADLVKYLDDLLAQKTISLQHLNLFLRGLEKGQVIVPISEEEADVDVALAIHREGLQRRIGAGSFDRKLLVNWVKGVLKAQDKTTAERNDVSRESKESYPNVKFHPVSRGKFEYMYHSDLIYKIEFTHDIEVMSGPVSQTTWVEYMGKNPSHFKTGPDSVFAVVKGSKVELLPNHPVENITWWSALAFANAVSEAHGRTPVYDFADIIWKKGTSAAEGTLEAESGELRIDAPNGDVYQADGYRLPMDVEFLYLLSKSIDPKSPFFQNRHDPNLEKNSWFKGNSQDATQAIGVLPPVQIEGNDFHDLFGNVRQWVFDCALSCGLRPNGVSQNPVGVVLRSRQFRDARGSSYDSTDISILGASGFNDSRYPAFGLRLVRTIR